MTFRIFADGVRILPDGVIEHVSKAEASLIFTEADKLKKVQETCVERLLDAREPWLHWSEPERTRLPGLQRPGSGRRNVENRVRCRQ